MAYRGRLTGEQIDQLPEMIDQKQDRLVDGQTIKTVNGQSLLGPGNIVIQGGGGQIAPSSDMNSDFNNDF